MVARWSRIANRVRVVVNCTFDALVCPEVRAHGHVFRWFRVCGCTGFAVAVALTSVLAAHDSLSLWVLVAIILAVVTVFFILALMVKVATGVESMTYYHHQFAALGAAGGISAFLHRPVMPYLDVTALGIGALLVFGRLGCLLAGCCHGKPSRWGPRYRPEHAEAGFPACYVGVRLLPVQLLESAWVSLVVLVGTALLLRGSPHGTPLDWYLTAYACGRFVLEFLRGDWVRPYMWGFSEAQWTSLIVAVSVMVAGWAGRLPLRSWFVAATVVPTIVMTGLSLYRWAATSIRHRLLHPYHIREVIEILQWLTAAGGSPSRQGGIPVVSTSLGIRLSAGVQADGICHYTVSSGAPGDLDKRSASTLADLICRVCRSVGGYDLVGGAPGVFHVIVDPSRQDPQPRFGGVLRTADHLGVDLDSQCDNPVGTRPLASIHVRREALTIRVEVRDLPPLALSQQGGEAGAA
jgi:prolipoprotein diacylglyceryltransferase